MNKNLFSIIIPVYNVENYLTQCLDSVVNQTFKNIEIICVNDCSPDSCGAILAEYAKNDNRIKVITHKTNLGLGGARNTGIENSNGEYIFFLDSDDWIELNTFEILAAAAEKMNFPDLLLINYNTVNASTREVSKNLIKYNIPQYNDNNLVTCGIQTGIISAWLKCAKHTLYKNFRFIEHCQAEDIPSFFLFCLAKNCLIVDEGLYNYRIGRAGSIITETSVKMHYGVLLNTNRIINLLNDSKIEDTIKIKALNYFSDRVINYKHIRGYFNSSSLKEKCKVAEWIKTIVLFCSILPDKEKNKLRKIKNPLYMVLLYYTIYKNILCLDTKINFLDLIKKIIKHLLPYGVIKILQERKNK